MATLSNVKYYENGGDGPSTVIGYADKHTRVVRFEFTTGSNGASGITITTNPGTIQDMGGASVTSIPFYITTSATSHANAMASNGYAVHGYITKSGDAFSGSADVILKENTTYYIWFFPNNSTYGWAYWHNNATYNFLTNYTLNGRSRYTMTVTAGTGAVITVNRLSSAVGGIGNISSGANIYLDDRLKISFTPGDNYAITTRTVNGKTFTSGNTHKVTGDVTIIASATPQKSTIGASDANIGSTSTITVTRYNSSYKHTISYSFGELSGIICSLSSDTSIAWTVPAEFYAQIPDSQTGVCTITCTTYNGDLSLGDTTCTMTVTASRNLCVPTVHGTVIDTNASTVALTGDNSILIRYKSTATCTIEATAHNSATISSMSINNMPLTSSEKVFREVSETSFVFNATDSRDYSASYTVNPTVIAYIQLTCNPIISRPTPAGSQIVLSATGNLYRGSFGSEPNTLTLQYRYMETGGYYSEWMTVDASEIVLSTTGYSCTNVLLGDSFDYQKSYVFQIRATDGTPSTVLSIVNQTVPIQKGTPVFDWGENDFNFNVPVTINGVSLIDIFYPVGSVYISSTDTMPDSLSSQASWESIETGISGVAGWKRTE